MSWSRCCGRVTCPCWRTSGRRCGLNTRKAESLRDIARAIESGELTEEKISGMNTRDALRALTELPGIGPWSAGLVLLRSLGRLDVFPPGDVGAARRLRALMGLRPGVSFSRVVERFGNHRGYLYFCGLGGCLLARGLIHAAPPKPTRTTGTARTRLAAEQLPRSALRAYRWTR
jgi:DNA-3-methyladenine glycosylase II